MTHPYFDSVNEEKARFQEATPERLSCYRISNREEITVIEVEKHDYFYGWLANFLEAHNITESNYNEWLRYELTTDSYEPFGDNDELIVISGAKRIFLILRDIKADSAVLQNHLDMVEPEISEEELPGYGKQE